MNNLAISNIGWTSDVDEDVYGYMQLYGFNGLEIAPTRIISNKPYGNLITAEKWINYLKKKHGLSVPSMQSIWYGRNERIFGSEEERIALIDYTKKAIDFAETIGCKNLVFGCPRNRSIPENAKVADSIPFFKTIGDYALEHGCVIAMEANPTIYNTNFINTTEQALELIKMVDCPGFLLNLDVGTMVENGESVSVIKDNEKFIHHIHISEPGLKPIVKRSLHNELADMLKAIQYNGFVSIEVGKQDDVASIEKTMMYVKSVFGDV